MDNAFSFRSSTANPIEQGDDQAVSKLRSLLKCICLRRTRDLLHLPEPNQQVQHLELSAEEREEYRNIAAIHKQAIDDAVSGNNAGQAYQGLSGHFAPQTVLQPWAFFFHLNSSSSSLFFSCLERQFVLIALNE